MYEMFASWYSQVWPPNPQRLRERWLAVESLVQTLSAEAVLDYAALAFGCGENSPTRQVIRDAAIRFDQSYVPSKDEHELSLLASAVVAHGLGDGPAISDVLALAIVCVQFGIALWGKTNDEHTWQEAFLRSTSLNPEARYPLLQLARQSYLEQILCSTLAAVQRLGNKTHALATSQGSRG